MEEFNRLLGEISGDAFSLEIFGDSILGGERDLMEGLNLGTIDLAIVSNMYVSNFVDDFKVFDLPYIFSNYNQVLTVLADKELLAPLAKKLLSGNKTVFLSSGTIGFRHVIVAQRLMVGMDSFVLLAVPLFTLSGYLMEQGGLSRRLVEWVGKLFGGFRGSAGTITIVCCAIFAALTGSGPATVAAIGAVMLPALLKSGYPRSTAAGMLAAGGALGPIIPPSIAMIVYGSTMNLSIPKMFVGSIIPGIIIVLLYIAVNQLIVYRNPAIKVEKHDATLPETIRATISALPVLFLPLLVLGGIYGGVFTPTEAATVCVVYSLALGLVYRELSVSKLLEAGRKTVTTSASIALIIGISSSFGWILASARIPAALAKTMVPLLANVHIYTILLLLILFVVGCLMETLSSIVILAPLLVPIGIEMGMDPLHLGVVFSITLVVGFITPPFGINLFTAVSITGTSFVDVVRGVLPFMTMALIACVIFAFFPDIILWLPSLTYK